MDLTFYYDLICKQPLLTKEEEEELLRVYHSEDSSTKQKARARDKIINANLRFVFKKAKQFSKGNSDQFEELIAAGNEGLIVALDKFQPGKQVRFLTYAGWWVVQRQLKEMSKMRLVALPIWKQQLSARIMKIADASPTPLTAAQIHEKMPDVALKDIDELYNTRYLTFFFEDLGEDNFYEESFLENLIRDLDDGILDRKMASCLTPLQINIIILSFGIDDGKEKSLTSIAESFDMSVEDVRSQRKMALEKLKEAFST